MVCCGWWWFVLGGVQKLGKTASEVFAEEGEEAWRKQETSTLTGVSARPWATQAGAADGQQHLVREWMLSHRVMC